MMGIGNFVAAQFLGFLVECTLAHLCTERAGIAFFSVLKNNLIDIGRHNGIGDMEFLAERLDGIHRYPFKAQINGNCFYRKWIGIESGQTV